MSLTREPIQFQDVWHPYRPLATNDYGRGVYRHPRDRALELRHIEANSPHSTNLLVVDIDHRDGFERAIWDRDGWRPNWVATNPLNGHAHAIWALRTGIARTEYARRKPLAYGAAVLEGLRRSVDGDPGYAGLMTKNPVHEDWDVVQFVDDLYSLDDLFGHLDDLGFMPPQDWRKRAKRDVSGLGRNCQLFELLRNEAYPAINRYWGDADGYAKHVETLAIQINADSFATPLPHSEVKASARSVSRWVTTKSTMWQAGKEASDERFKARQSYRGTRSAMKRSQAKDELIKAARDAYRASGGTMTNKQIADGVGMSIKWVEKHRAAIKG